MDPSNGPSEPSLWVFLIIVLAVLLGIVVGTSFVMHFVQRAQRKHLERRIARGEVDLEALGIKRLNVPQEAIEKMPQYTFKSGPDNNSAPERGDAGVVSKEATTTGLFQPTCSICLDDFIYNETRVRELPCKHIFHPECIDPFLRENSSLCPLCKRSALPPGYCPITVTNVMVRRERLTRRLREGNHPQVRRYGPTAERTTWSQRLNEIRHSTGIRVPDPARVRDANPTHGTAEVVPDASPVSNEVDTELGPIAPPNNDLLDVEQPPPEIARRGTIARRAWRRERVASMHAREYNEQAEAARRQEEGRPIWRRILGLN